MNRWRLPLCFLAVVVVGLAWAIYTDHAWEDYYITYRVSKNLATGHGLTFTVGERVHAFTSPLGVLLPTLASLLTLNSSDAAALWLFRLMSIAALGGAAVLLWRTLLALRVNRWAAVLLVALLATDTKIVDFSTNGMETGILLLFLAYALHAMFARSRLQALHLGLAWAGLMWTRPDAFVYAGALALGMLLFRPAQPMIAGRWRLLRTFVIAALVAGACYAPWFLWAWWYYGSPLPHTIVAKGLFRDSSLPAVLEQFVRFPLGIFRGTSTLPATFMPPYELSAGWPPFVAAVSWAVSLAILPLWLIPVVRWEARVTAFGFAAGQFYLTGIIGFPVPWYIPVVSLLGFVTIALVFAQALNGAALLERVRPADYRAAAIRRASWMVAGGLVMGSAVLSASAAYSLRWQQRLIERGNRQPIGEWLRSHAGSPEESVFLEPLGYIGFYSGLKMLDYPGLSSPEVIAARRRAEGRSYPDCWAELVRDLQPDWLVLRDYEAYAIRSRDRTLLKDIYQRAAVFDVRDRIRSIRRLPARKYLLNDAHFEVYRRHAAKEAVPTRAPEQVPIVLADLLRAEALDQVGFSNGVFGAHAPSLLACRVPAGARAIIGRFGIAGGAYADPENGTDGAEFRVELLGVDGNRTELFQQLLRPLIRPEDRGAIDLEVELPPGAEGEVEFIISPGPAGDSNFDWTFWENLHFEVPQEEATPVQQQVLTTRPVER